MTHCDGRLFDGSACNNDLVGCVGCGVTGCTGDGCDNQAYVNDACDCGVTLLPRQTFARRETVAA